MMSSILAEPHHASIEIAGSPAIIDVAPRRLQDIALAQTQNYYLETCSRSSRE